MSISTIQEKLFNKGCGSVLIVVAAAAMGLSMFSQCNSASRMNEENAQGGGQAVATVDGVPVMSGAIQALAARSSGGDSPVTEAFSLAQATNEAVNAAAVRALIAKGPAVTEAEVEKAALLAINETIEGMRGQLTSTGTLKPGASEAEFEKALGAQTGGKKLADIRKETVAAAKSKFAAAETKASVVEALAPGILAARLGEKAVGSDAQLRDSYKTYVVKRIFFGSQSGSKDSPDARAKKAEADLKAGKGFDLLMDTVSNDPAPAGKPMHDATESLPTALFDARPELASLKDKPVGTTTGVVDVPGGKAIYRLEAVRNDVPADFEKNKAKLREERIAAAGKEASQSAVRDLVAKSTKWESKGFEALAGAANAFMNPTASEKAVAAAQAALKSSDTGDKRRGALAMLLATTSMTGAPDTAKSEQRIAALEAAQAAGIEDATLSLELADLYAAKKDGAKTTAALVAASRLNRRYDAGGGATFREIATKLRKLQDDKVLTAEQAKQVQEQQAVWQAAKAEADKSAAAAKTQSGKTDLSNEAEIARQKAEAAKASGVTATVQPPKKDADKDDAAEIARQKAEAEKAKGKGQ